MFSALGVSGCQDLVEIDTEKENERKEKMLEVTENLKSLNVFKNVHVCCSVLNQ